MPHKDRQEYLQYQKDYQPEYRKRNLEKCRASARKWALKNRDKTRAKYYANHEQNKVKKREYARKWRAENAAHVIEKWRESNYKKYGLSIEKYETLLAAQNNMCAGCSKSFKMLDRKSVV